MKILDTKGWVDYELLDSGGGYRLERFGNYVIAKPDPQAIWERKLSEENWKKSDAFFNKNTNTWEKNKLFPEKWKLSYKNLSFIAKLTPFKHTGIFPEQHINWDFIEEKVTTRKGCSVLNLFGYTGVASLAAALGGAKVTHVDASKSSIAWARDNQTASGLVERPIRWILDDATKFVAREIRRGNKYDAIIMDPPVYGHGPEGELWDFSKSFPELIKLSSQILSPDPLFFLVNAYAISSSAIMLENVIRDWIGGGEVEVGELALREKSGDRLLSTGIFARWSTK